MSKKPVITKEYEAQFFGFSAHGFINFYYNNLVESWTKVVDEVLMPKLLENVGKEQKKEADALREKLLDRLFQHGKLHVILNEAQKHLSQYILKIPANVTLPEDEPNLTANDEANLLEQIEQLSHEILELQSRIKAGEVHRQNSAAKLALERCLADEGICLDAVL